jgi:hypothetical protein
MQIIACIWRFCTPPYQMRNTQKERTVAGVSKVCFVKVMVTSSLCAQPALLALDSHS